MSSILFYDCYAPYPVYAKTEYIDGDRKFGDLKKNDPLLHAKDMLQIKE